MKTLSQFSILGLCFSIGILCAQPYIISTVAGGAAPLRTPVRALDLAIQPWRGIVTADDGSVLFANGRLVLKLTPDGNVSRFAGTAQTGFSGDAGLAANAQFSFVGGLAIDMSGNLFIADTGNHRVRKVSPDGIISTVVGNGTEGYSGDGGRASEAQLTYPTGLAADSSGNLFIADGFRIRRVSAGGIITTIAGTGSSGYSGDGGPATSAQLNEPHSLVVDFAGNLLIGDVVKVRKVGQNGVITTVAGSGACYSDPNVCIGDGGPATQAWFRVSGMALDAAGNLFIGDNWHNRVRKISPNGIITTIAGVGDSTMGTGGAFSGDGGPAAAAMLNTPGDLAMDASGNLYVSDAGNFRLRKISPDAIINTVAGNGDFHSFANEAYLGQVPIQGERATNVQFIGTFGVAVDSSDILYLTATFLDEGGFSSDNRVYRLSPDGIITTVAGNGIRGFSGDDGPATSAQLNSPAGVALDKSDNLFIADARNSRVRKVTAGGTISTVAWSGCCLSFLAIDSAGNLFFSDYESGRKIIRKFSPDGSMTTVVSVRSRYWGRLGVAADMAGNVFFADPEDNRVSRISPDGNVTTVAGNGTPGFSGDGGPAQQAQLFFPAAVAVDRAGNLFITDAGNQRVRLVSTDGIITTIAGNGSGGYSGDGGPATRARLSWPAGVAVDSRGNVYVADANNGVVRVLRPVHTRQ